MKSLVYLLLAAALSTGMPGLATAEDADPGDEATETTATGPERRSWVVRQAAACPGVPLPEAAATLAVRRHHSGITEIRPLTVGAPGRISQADAAKALLRAALLDCRTAGDLKIVVDLPLPLDVLLPECARHRFNYAGSRMRDRRITHEFFADLYSKDG